jgi:hypothetical protein
MQFAGRSVCIIRGQLEHVLSHQTMHSEHARLNIGRATEYPARDLRGFPQSTPPHISKTATRLNCDLSLQHSLQCAELPHQPFHLSTEPPRRRTSPVAFPQPLQLLQATRPDTVTLSARAQVILVPSRAHFQYSKTCDFVIHHGSLQPTATRTPTALRNPTALRWLWPLKMATTSFLTQEKLKATTQHLLPVTCPTVLG